MKIALAVIEATLATVCPDEISRWCSDVQAEGWTVKQRVVPASMAVADVARIVQTDCPTGHLQLFGRVPVPVVIDGPDGHGFRPGDVDAPYGTADMSGWGWNGSAFTTYYWPVGGAVRSVSRSDLSGMPNDGDEATLFRRVMARNHAYRTGAFEYDGIACINNRLSYLDSGINLRLRPALEAIVGAGNICDLTGQYPDDTFFESYRSRSFLLGVCFSGGNPFAVDEYYIGNEQEFASGQVQFGLLRIFCSNGWLFEQWPLQRAGLAGGALAVLYDPWGYADLRAWDSTHPLGDVLRQERHYQGSDFLWTFQGDGTLCRRAQDMGVSQAVFDAAMVTVNSRLTTLESGAAPGPVPVPVPLPVPPGGTDLTGTPDLKLGSQFTGGFWLAAPWHGMGQAYFVYTFSAADNGGKDATILQFDGANASRTLTGLVIGQTYTLSFAHAYRKGYPGGRIDFSIDGKVVGNVTPSSCATIDGYKAGSVSFTATAVSHVLKMQEVGGGSVFVAGLGLA